MLLNNAVYMMSCQSVLPSLALSSLLILTIIFNLKLEHTGFQKALQYIINIFISIQFSHSVVSNSLWPHDPQHVRPPSPSPIPRVYLCPLSKDIQPMPSNRLILCGALLLSPSISCWEQHESLFKWDSSSHQVAKVLEFQFQHQSFPWIFRTDFL